MNATIETRHQHIALFFTLIALLLAVAFRALRWGVETDTLLFWKIVALAIFTLNAPAPLGYIRLISSPLLAGFRMLLALAIGVTVLQLGVTGMLVLGFASVAAFAVTLRGARGAPVSAPRLLALLVIALLSTIAIAGDYAATKYTSALSDQLALYGRADGDVLMHASLINSLHYFGIPSAGIDGIAWTHYHFGLHALVALLVGDSALNSVLAFSLVKLLLIYPLTFCAAAQSALLLRPAAGREVGVTLILVILLFVVFAPPIDTTYLASANSETGIFSGFLVIALLPAFHVALMDPAADRAGRVRALAIAALLIVPMSLFKVSAGFTWACAVFLWSLYGFGLRDKVTWIAWAVAAAGGLVSLQLFPQPGIATPFGTPYFVERARSTGDYFLALTLNIGSLLYLALAILRQWRAGTLSLRALLADRDVCFIALMMVFANLPGVFLDIVSGNAGHFIIQQNLLALPFLVAQLAALARDSFFTGKERGLARYAAVAASLLIVGFGLYGFGDSAVANTRTFIVQRALIDTGDPSYYASRKKRDLKADVARFKEQKGLGTLLSRVDAMPPAAILAAALEEARSQYGNDIAIYASPAVSGFWGLTYDCDAKTLFTMTAAGVPMINGFPPCQPKFVNNGYPPIIGTAPLDDKAVCARAQQVAISHVLVINSLEDRAQDRPLDCGPGSAGAESTAPAP